MRKFFLIIILICMLIIPINASYTMMTDIKNAYFGGGCSRPNGTALSSSYDGDENTWTQNDCQIRVQFNHNWTVDFCHFKYSNIGPTSEPWSVYWNGYMASPNSTTLYKNGAWKSLSPKASASTYFPIVWQNASQYLAFSRGDTGTFYLSEWECFGTSTEVVPAVSSEFQANVVSGLAPLTVTFTDLSVLTAVSDPEYNWTNSGSGVSWVNASGPSSAATFSSPGVYTISHAVWSNTAGVSDIEIKTDYITVFDSTGFTVTPSTGASPLPVSFSLIYPAAVGAGGVTWVWGDDSPATVSTEPIVSHTYSAEGNYTPIIYYYNTVGALKSATNGTITVSGIAPPTPVTPTPTGTPIPSTLTNITYTFVDYDTSSYLQNVYVEHWFNGKTSSLQGYTDVYGRIEFDYVDVEESVLKAWKSNYQNIEEVHYPTPFSYATTVYMYPSTGEDTIPERINITLTIRNSNGGAAIPSAYVTLRDNIAGTGEISASTDASGVVVFKNVPNTAYIMGDITRNGFNSRTWSKDGVSLNDYEDTLYMTSTSGQPGTPTITPTVTPAPYDNVILSVNPTAIELGSSATLLASATQESFWQKAALIFYYVTPPSGSEVSIGQFKKNSTSGNYDFRTTSAMPWSVGSTNGRTLAIYPSMAGNHQYRLYVSNVTAGNTATNIGSSNVNLMVGGAGQYGELIMTLYAGDGATTSHLNNYYLNLTEDATGTITELGAVVYDVKKSLSRGSSYTLKGNKSGYIDGSYTFTVPVDESCIGGSFCSYAGVSLYPPGSIVAGNTSITVHVNDAETYFPLPNVLIQESDANSSYAVTEKYTGSDGESVLFSVPYNTDYAITAIKDGYCTVSEAGNTGTDEFKYVGLYMKYGACSATPTPTPSPTSSIAPTPVPTLIGGWGNNTREAYVCNQNPEHPSFIDIAMNSLACSGITTAQDQGIAISLLICLLAALILGKVAGGIGAAIGALIGMLLSMLLGFLPLWVVVVLIIIAGLIFAVKLFAGGSE